MGSSKCSVSVTIIKCNLAIINVKGAMVACGVKHIQVALFFYQFFKPGRLFKIIF